MDFVMSVRCGLPPLDRSLLINSSDVLVDMHVSLMRTVLIFTAVVFLVCAAPAKNLPTVESPAETDFWGSATNRKPPAANDLGTAAVEDGKGTASSTSAGGGVASSASTSDKGAPPANTQKGKVRRPIHGKRYYWLFRSRINHETTRQRQRYGP